MSYYVQTRWGDSEDQPDERRMRELLAELNRSDPEHPDTWLTHESGWTLSIHENGLLVWENLELDVQPRHQTGISQEKALELWLKLSQGDIAVLHKEPWHPGQAPPRTAEEQAKLVKEAEEKTLAIFRNFYAQLGLERANVPCRHDGCKRGAISNSVFCKIHHFENIYRRPCPFDD